MFNNIFYINETTFVKRISTQSEIEEWRELIVENFKKLDVAITKTLDHDIKSIESWTLTPVGCYHIDTKGKVILTCTQSIKVTTLDELSQRVLEKYKLRESDSKIFMEFTEDIINSKSKVIIEISRHAKRKIISTTLGSKYQILYVVGFLRFITNVIFQKEKCYSISITSKRHASSLAKLFQNLRDIDSYFINLLSADNNLEISILSYPNYMIEDKYLNFFSQYKEEKGIVETNKS